MKTELEELNNYTGPSMNPTFTAGDGLRDMEDLVEKGYAGYEAGGSGAP